MDSNRTALIREAFRQAENKQASMLQVAIASDARAMSLSVACAGIAGVLIGIDAVGNRSAASVPVLVTSASFFISACLAAWSGRPISFAVPGQDYSDFETDIDSNTNIDAVLMELGGHLDKDAFDNQKRLTTNAKFFRSALYLAAVSPLVGLLTLMIIGC